MANKNWDEEDKKYYIDIDDIFRDKREENDDDYYIDMKDIFDDESEEDEVTEGKFGVFLGRVLSVIIAFNIVSFAWDFFFTDTNAKDRKYLLDNLYSGKNFSSELNDDKIEEMISNFEEKFKIDIEKDEEDEYCLLDAINKNENLTIEEKEFFYNYIDVFLDNPYLNKEKVYYALLNLDVKHKRRPIDAESTLEGIYALELVDIEIYVADSNNYVLAHEGIHCIYINEDTVNLPTYFKEGVTELLTNEYFSSDPYVEVSNYPFEVAAVKVLCNLSSSDAVLKAATYGDMSYIAQEMANNSGSSIEEANKAIDNIGTFFSIFYKEKEISTGELNVIFDELYDYCDRCITDEEVKKSYSYNNLLLFDIFYEAPYQAYCDDLLKFGYERKAYFSSKLKEECNSSPYSRGSITEEQIKKLVKSRK